jgi:hypothetical protein
VKKKTSMEWDPMAGAGENVRLSLPAAVTEFFALGRNAAASTDPASLHAFRLASKRFRYTLELFRPLYGPGLDPKIEAVRRIQSVLGDRQDFAVLSARLRNSPMPSEALLDALRASDAKGLELEQRFREYWTGEFDVPGAEGRWLRYITRRPPVPRVRTLAAPPVKAKAPRAAARRAPRKRA